MNCRITSIENMYQHRIFYSSLRNKLYLNMGPKEISQTRPMHWNISIHFGTLKNSSFIFEVSFPLSLWFIRREVPLCAIHLYCYLHSLFKISMTFLPRDGFQCCTKLFIFTTNLPVLTSSCPATRYSKPKREQRGYIVS